MLLRIKSFKANLFFCLRVPFNNLNNFNIVMALTKRHIAFNFFQIHFNSPHAFTDQAITYYIVFYHKNYKILNY